jgi:hypothetical protein
LSSQSEISFVYHEKLILPLYFWIFGLGTLGRIKKVSILVRPAFLTGFGIPMDILVEEGATRN